MIACIFARLQRGFLAGIAQILGTKETWLKGNLEQSLQGWNQGNLETS
jgi:hypothetical protein